MIENKLDCILLVDDDRATNFLNERLLNKMGIANSVRITRNGVEAIDYLKKSIENEPECPWPDFILLDINMPLVNGWEFLDEYKKLITELKKSTVILMLTTSLQEADEKRAGQMEAVKGFIKKPLSQPEIQKIMTTHFAGR